MSSGSQMLAGGVLLTVTAALLGEFRGFHVQAVSRAAWFALLYLIVAGSIVAFTAYVWLIHHESPTKVGTYAYVNPVVAVLVGYFLGGETHRRTHALRNVDGAGQRDRDHDHARKEGQRLRHSWKNSARPARFCDRR